MFSLSEFASRRCSTEGQWEGGPSGSNTNSTVGWTNYTMCISPEMAELMHKLNHGERKLKLDIAERTRVLEIVGLSISLVTLLISLIIFYHFRWVHKEQILVRQIKIRQVLTSLCSTAQHNKEFEEQQDAHPQEFVRGHGHPRWDLLVRCI